MSEPFIVVEAYERDGLTLVAELPRRWGVTGAEPMNVPGACSIKVDPKDPILDRHPGIFNYGRVIKFWLGRGDGTGDYVSGFRIRHRTLEVVSDGEHVAYVRTLSGPTVHGDLDRFVIKHETPPTEKSADIRMFGWASAQGAWYDADDWDHAFNDFIWTDPSSNKKEDQPSRWPDPKAYWLHAGGSEWEYWRTSFTPTEDIVGRIYFSSDENGKVYYDGEEVISTDSVEVGYTDMSRYTVVMEGGVEHTIGVRSHGIPQPLADGADEFILVVCSISADGGPEAVVHRSKPTGWKVSLGTPPPGWHKAQILRTCIEEAQDRGNDFANFLDWNFTGTEDTDEESWNDNVTMFFPIGTTVLDLQAQLSEKGNFDVWIDPANMVIKAWKQRGTDRTSAVTLEPGRNLVNWTVEEDEAVKNDIIVKYNGGWAEVEDSDSITEFGRNEVMINLGHVNDSGTATDIGEQILETIRDVDKHSGASDTVKTDEDEQPSGSLIGVPGAIPMLDFKTGDAVSALNGELEMVSHIVLSLTVTENDETGLLTWDPELYEAEL